KYPSASPASIYPGHMQFTRIPSFPWSIAIAFVSPMIAALVAQYPAQEGSAKYPLTEDMFTMFPPVALSIGRNCLEQRNTPPTFTDICASHSSKLVSAMVLFTWMAALLIKESIFPYVLIVVSTRAATE